MFEKLKLIVFGIILFVSVTNCINEERKVAVLNLRVKRLLACLQSAGVDRNKIHLRNSGSQYTELNFQWNTLNGYIEPLAYLVATSVSDIQKAVICCRSSKIRIVPRSGGHSYVKNGFGDSQSLVVDLASMNHISLNAKRMQCEVGPGARNGRISYMSWKEGFIVAQGICPSVGISGLALGGGYGHFSRLLGLSSDNLIEAEMVDANGKLLVMNNTTNKDLFWAIRGGGGGNFGIVSKFTFKTYPAPKSIIYGQYKFRFSDFEQFYSAFQTLVFSGQPNNIFSIIYAEGDSIRMKLYALNGKNIKNVSVNDMKQLYRSLGFPVARNSSIEILSHSEFILREAQSYSDVLLTHPSQLVNMTKHNHVGWKKVKSIYVKKILNKEKISILKELLHSYLKNAGFNMEFFGGAVNNVSPSQTAFVHRGNSFHFQLVPLNSQGVMPNKETDFAMKTFFELSKAIFDHRESYQNYLDQDFPDYLTRYYGANLEKLIRVKRSVDPENIFHHPESIPVVYN